MIEQQDSETYAIIGAAMEVHKNLGHGFLEAVYQEALTEELILQKIPFRREVELPVCYKTRQLKTSYKADFICYDRVIVELKALDMLGGREQSQVINYLKAADYEKALLINFGAPRLHYKRIILTTKKE